MRNYESFSGLRLHRVIRCGAAIFIIWILISILRRLGSTVETPDLELLDKFSKCFQNEQGSKNGTNCALELNIGQGAPELVEYVRKRHIFSPSEEPYNLVSHFLDKKYPKYHEWKGQVTQRVLQILNHTRKGFFIEAGANDGLFLSNTLPLEKNYSWTGLLVEADPQPFVHLRQKQRKAWLTDLCLSITNFPNKITMMRHIKGSEGGSFNPKLFKGAPEFEDHEQFQTTCFPLYTILRAVGATSVDYFSMDMEGVELAVLKTFPFDKIPIKVLSLELEEKVEETNEFLKSKGYVLDKYIQEYLTNDQIYVHKSII